MKKMLLILGAALASSIITSQAQVYSQNVVGYVNTVTPAHSYSLIANPLYATGPNGTNSVNDVLVSGSFVSGGTGQTQSPNQSVLYAWNGAGYNTLFYWSSNDLTALNSGTYYGPNGWYDASFTLSSATLPQSGGAFLYNPSASGITNTFTGTVVQGSVTNTVVTGFNLVSIPFPIASQSLNSTNFSFPSYGDNASEIAYIWNGTTFQNVFYYSAAYLLSLDPNYIADGYVPGWYDAGGTIHPNGDAIWGNVGNSIFVYYPGPTTNWVSTFNVQ